MIGPGAFSAGCRRHRDIAAALPERHAMNYYSSNCASTRMIGADDLPKKDPNHFSKQNPPSHNTTPSRDEISQAPCHPEKHCYANPALAGEGGKARVAREEGKTRQDNTAKELSF